MAMNITDIYETINSKTESFFEWVQAHPKIGLLFAAGLLALWFVGILLRVGVDATARGMKPPILTVAPSIPTAIVSTVCPTSASFALSASSVCSAVGGGGMNDDMAAAMKSCRNGLTGSMKCSPRPVF